MGDIAIAAFVGGVQGRLTAGAFKTVGDYSLMKGLNSYQQTALHGLTGGGLGLATGSGNKGFKNGFVSAAVSKGFGEAGGYQALGNNKLSNAVAAGVVGGTASKLTGGDFANGARTASFARLFNDVGHSRGRRNYKPDNDGHITLGEANWQYRNGNGAPLSADLSKIDLSGISHSDFSGGLGSTIYPNMLHPKNLGTTNDGLVYGSVGLSLGPNNTVTATYDTYDFDIKPWGLNTFIRNIETLIGQSVAGQGQSFRINFYGTGNIGP